VAKRVAFSEMLKSLRGQSGLSQSALAERSGVAVSTIRQFEYGLREPTYGTLVKLASGLGVSLAAFDVTDPAPDRDAAEKPLPKVHKPTRTAGSEGRMPKRRGKK
jgi:transcriptional regulator with XRE-family HTH domain